MANPLWKKIVANASDDGIRKVDKGIDIVDRIHQLREQRGWSQKRLAKELGKSPAEISKWLAAGHNFTIRTIAKLESVFGEDILLTPARHHARELEKQFPSVDKDDLYDRCLEAAQTAYDRSDQPSMTAEASVVDWSIDQWVPISVRTLNILPPRLKLEYGGTRPAATEREEDLIEQ